MVGVFFSSCQLCALHSNTLTNGLNNPLANLEMGRVGYAPCAAFETRAQRDDFTLRERPDQTQAGATAAAQTVLSSQLSSKLPSIIAVGSSAKILGPISMFRRT